MGIKQPKHGTMKTATKLDGCYKGCKQERVQGHIIMVYSTNTITTIYGYNYWL